MSLKKSLFLQEYTPELYKIVSKDTEISFSVFPRRKPKHLTNRRRKEIFHSTARPNRAANLYSVRSVLPDERPWLSVFVKQQRYEPVTRPV
jgi:hypothetical protein